jgi:hypothetical protein
MAIIFTKKKRKQNVLVFIFAFIIIITVIVLWQGFSKKSVLIFSDQTTVIPPREVNIDFQALEKINLFEPFVEIKPFSQSYSIEQGQAERQIGRSNPFLTY